VGLDDQCLQVDKMHPPMALLVNDIKAELLNGNLDFMQWAAVIE
jgi:hypothetical protein